MKPHAHHTSLAFSFSAENQKKIKEILSKYPVGRQNSAVLPLLDLAQRQEGWVSQAAIEEIARLLNMPPLSVYEVASFYTMINLKPVGHYHVQVCGTTPCWLRGAGDLRAACEQRLGVKTGSGELTPDGLFCLSEVECLGACVDAPVVQINDDYYENLTPETIVQVLDQLTQKKIQNFDELVQKTHKASRSKARAVADVVEALSQPTEAHIKADIPQKKVRVRKISEKESVESYAPPKKRRLRMKVEE